MKKCLTILVLAFCLHFQSMGQDIQYTSTIDILSLADEQTVKGEHDLIVTHDGERYTFEFYVKHGKKIQMHRAYVMTDKVYSRASFVWESDRQVAIQLFNEHSTDVFELKLWGEKRGTGMEVETES